MYHGTFKNTHYQAGFHWGEMLRKHGNFIHKQHTFQITKERKKFAMQCLPVYEKYYPEVLEEIKGIADGQQSSYEDLCTFLLSMYCFEFSNHCTCFAFRDQEHIVFGRNSDFLTELKKLYMNCLYQLDGGYSFQGNTTAFVQMEDGINEYGFMCQYDRKAGADTVWSVIYDIKEQKIYRVEGNPSRKGFKEDKRFKFKN